MKKYKESVADCNSALELNENYLKAILRRAASRMELEEYDAAVADYDKAHRMDRSNGETRRLLQVFKMWLVLLWFFYYPIKKATVTISGGPPVINIP